MQPKLVEESVTEHGVLSKHCKIYLKKNGEKQFVTLYRQTETLYNLWFYHV